MKQTRILSFSLILLLLSFACANESDAVTGASPQLSIEDSLKSFHYIEAYTSLVDSLQEAGALTEYTSPGKTEVGGFGGYLLNDAPLLLMGKDGGEKAKLYYNVYLEKGALRKIVYMRRETTEVQKEILLRTGAYFDDSKHAYIEKVYEIYFGKVLQFRSYEDGVLLDKKEDLDLKKKLVETAEQMISLFRERE